MPVRLLVLLIGLVPAIAGAGEPAAYAFVDVGVVPMDREGVLLHQTVVVRGDRVAAVGPKDEVVVPADAVRLTGGRYLMPGLTDAHVHLVSATELPLYLRNGVTTVLNLHGQPAHLRWRKRVAEGTLASNESTDAGVVDGTTRNLGPWLSLR